MSITYPISIIFCALLLSPLVDTNLIPSTNFRWVIDMNTSWMCVIIGGYFCLLMMITFFLLLLFNLQKHDATVKKQSRLLFLGFSIPILVCVLVDFTFPLIVGGEPSGIASLSTTIFSISALIALTRFDLMHSDNRYFWKNVSMGMSEMVLLTDLNNVIRFCSDNFELHYGIPSGQLLDKPMDQFIRRTTDCTSNEAKLFCTYQKEPMWLKFKKLPYLNLKGKQIGYTYLFLDINKEKNAITNFINSEKKFQFLFDSSDDAILITLIDGSIILHNKAANEMLGVTDDTEDIELLLTQLGLLDERGNTLKLKELLKQFEIQQSFTYNSSNTINHYEISFYYWVFDNEPLICFIFRDITLKKNQEDLVRNAHNLAEAAERERISRELHDGLGQLLLGVNLQLTSILENEEMNGQLKSSLEMILKLNQKSINEARNISHNIVPADYSENGFGFGLKIIVDTFSMNTKIKLHLNNHYKDERLPVSSELHIMRIIQEFITNSLKYSEAKNIYISLYQEENNTILLELIDDGKGFDFQQALQSKDCLGLKNIIARSKLIAGILDVDCEEGDGTKFTIVIPYFN